MLNKTQITLKYYFSPKRENHLRLAFFVCSDQEGKYHHTPYPPGAGD